MEAVMRTVREMIPGTRPKLPVGEPWIGQKMEPSAISSALRTERAGGERIDDGDSPKELTNQYAGSRISQFRDKREIGRGRNAVIYSAMCTRTTQRVAIKAYLKRGLTPIDAHRVKREIVLLNMLQHENIIKCLGSFEDESCVYIVQEFALKGDLFEELKNCGGTMPERRIVVQVIAPLLSALQEMHSKGVIHRDLKPENILIDATDNIKVCDFGLGINACTERPASRLGTLQYMAPEVVKRPYLRPRDMTSVEAYDDKVDVWACGILVYELLMGRPPFEDSNDEATTKQIMYMELGELPQCMSEKCRDFVRKALQKHANDRPTVDQLRNHPFVVTYVRPEESVQRKRRAVSIILKPPIMVGGAPSPSEADPPGGTPAQRTSGQLLMAVSPASLHKKEPPKGAAPRVDPRPIVDAPIDDGHNPEKSDSRGSDAVGLMTWPPAAGGGAGAAVWPGGGIVAVAPHVAELALTRPPLGKTMPNPTRIDSGGEEEDGKGSSAVGKGLPLQKAKLVEVPDVKAGGGGGGGGGGIDKWNLPGTQHLKQVDVAREAESERERPHRSDSLSPSTLSPVPRRSAGAQPRKGQVARNVGVDEALRLQQRTIQARGTPALVEVEEPGSDIDSGQSSPSVMSPRKGGGGSNEQGGGGGGNDPWSQMFDEDMPSERWPTDGTDGGGTMSPGSMNVGSPMEISPHSRGSLTLMGYSAGARQNSRKAAYPGRTHRVVGVVSPREGENSGRGSAYVQGVPKGSVDGWGGEASSKGKGSSQIESREQRDGERSKKAQGHASGSARVAYRYADEEEQHEEDGFFTPLGSVGGHSPLNQNWAGGSETKKGSDLAPTVAMEVATLPNDAAAHRERERPSTAPNRAQSSASLAPQQLTSSTSSPPPRPTSANVTSPRAQGGSPGSSPNTYVAANNIGPSSSSPTSSSTETPRPCTGGWMASKPPMRIEIPTPSLRTSDGMPTADSTQKLFSSAPASPSLPGPSSSSQGKVLQQQRSFTQPGTADKAGSSHIPPQGNSEVSRQGTVDRGVIPRPGGGPGARPNSASSSSPSSPSSHDQQAGKRVPAQVVQERMQGEADGLLVLGSMWVKGGSCIRPGSPRLNMGPSVSQLRQNSWASQLSNKAGVAPSASPDNAFGSVLSGCPSPIGCPSPVRLLGNQVVTPQPSSPTSPQGRVQQTEQSPLVGGQQNPDYEERRAAGRAARPEQSRSGVPGPEGKDRLGARPRAPPEQQHSQDTRAWRDPNEDPNKEGGEVGGVLSPRGALRSWLSGFLGNG